MAKEFKTILLTKESWMNSQLSVAKYSGGVQVIGEGGKKFQLGIPLGDPADLVDKEFIPFYKKLGRDLFIAIIGANPLVSRKELKEILTQAADIKKKGEEAEKAAKREKEKRQNPSLFD